MIDVFKLVFKINLLSENTMIINLSSRRVHTFISLSIALAILSQQWPSYFDLLSSNFRGDKVKHIRIKRFLLSSLTIKLSYNMCNGLKVNFYIYFAPLSYYTLLAFNNSDLKTTLGGVETSPDR